MRNMLIGCLTVVAIVLIAVIALFILRARQNATTQVPPAPQPNPAPLSSDAAAPTIQIALPANGARVRVGQAFQVHAIATDARGISAIAFAVDGQVGAPIPATSALTTFATAIPITLQTKGVHTIAVLAQNANGVKSEPAAIKVVAVQSLSDPANPDDPPPPAPIPNPAPNPSGGTATISFVANPATIAAGQCSTLRWDVENVREVYFEGAGVAGHGEQQQCPAQTTTYSLITILNDGSPRTTTATITVSGNAPSPGGQTPSAPANLRVTATTRTSARIAWDDRANNEDGFELQVEGGASVRTNANETQYEMAGLTCNRAYNFRVRAFNAAGNSAWSNQVTAQTLACGDGTAFAVTNMGVSVNRATYNGPCPNTFTAGAKITTNGAGTVRYRWERSDGVSGQPLTLQFDAAGEKAVTNADWPLNTSGNYWMRLHVLDPNDLVSARGETTWTCTGGAAFAVTEALASVTPPTYTGTCPKSFAFAGRITTNGAGAVTYRWERSDGETSPTLTLNFPSGSAQTTVPAAWNAERSGTYSMRLHVLTPNEVLSEPATFTASCAGAQSSFAVTNVVAEVEPEIFSGTCPKNATYTGKITTNGAGTVSYRWVRSDGTGETRTLNFSAAGTQAVANVNMNYAHSATHWAKLEVLAPNALTSDQAKFTLNCASPAIVTLVSVNINPTAYTGSCPHTFNFNGTIVTNAPGTVTYRWERSDGTGETRTLNFSAASSQTVQSGDFRSGSSGTFWARLHVLTPNDKVSNQAQFTLTCK